MDWLELITEQGEVAQRMAANVPKVLGDPKLSLEDATKLYNIVEAGAQDLDELADKMDEFDLDEALFEAVEALQSIWDKLSVASANRVRTMQGLSPIEFPDDDELEDD